MIEVRRSSPDDITFIVSELRHFSNFFGTKIPLFPKDELLAELIIADMIRDHLFFTSFNDDVPSGFIAGWVSKHPFNPEIVTLTEAFWWVSERFRMTKAGSMLLDRFISWGRESVNWITMTLESESTVSSYPLLKRGFKLKETSFLMECE